MQYIERKFCFRFTAAYTVLFVYLRRSRALQAVINTDSLMRRRRCGKLHGGLSHLLFEGPAVMDIASYMADDRDLCLPHRHSTPPLGGPRRNIARTFGMEKLEWFGYPIVNFFLKTPRLHSIARQKRSTLCDRRSKFKVTGGRKWIWSPVGGILDQFGSSSFFSFQVINRGLTSVMD